MKKMLAYFKSKRYDTLAGVLSFFFVLSFIPLLYLCLSLYIKLGSYLNIETPIPEVIKDYVTFDLNAGVSVLFLITTIYSASKFFTELKKTGEIIYGIKKSNVTIKSQVISCIFVIFLILIVAFSLLAIAIGNTFLKYSWSKILTNILTYLILILMTFGFLCLVNKTACCTKKKLNDLKVGIIFSLIYIVIFSFLFGFYVANFANYNELYGVFSTVIIALLYVYLMMQGIVIGIIFNEKYSKEN